MSLMFSVLILGADEIEARSGWSTVRVTTVNRERSVWP